MRSMQEGSECRTLALTYSGYYCMLHDMFPDLFRPLYCARSHACLLGMQSSSSSWCGPYPLSHCPCVPLCRTMSYCCICCRAWLAEKEAMKQRRLAQEQARKEREAAAKAAAAAQRAEAHRKLMEERKAKYVGARSPVHSAADCVSLGSPSNMMCCMLYYTLVQPAVDRQQSSNWQYSRISQAISGRLAGP